MKFPTSTNWFMFVCIWYVGNAVAGILRAHRRDNAPMWHAWVGAFLCPILLVVVWNYCRNIALLTGVETGWTLQLILRERFWLV